MLFAYPGMETSFADVHDRKDVLTDRFSAKHGQDL